YSYQNSSDTIQSVYYHIMPKNTASGCLPGDTVVAEVKIHPKPLRKMYLSKPFTCEGGANGIMTAILSKGSKPDIVHWSRPSYLGDLIYPTTSDTANMAIQYSGQYYVTVTDNLNCTNSYLDDTTAYQVLGPVFQSVLDVNNYSTGYGVTCPGSSDGSIRIMEDVSSTGKEPFKYWLIHNYTDTLGSGTLVTKGTISTVTGLPAGTYKLSIRDANGCYNMNPPEIDISAPAVISVQFAESKYNGFNVSCKNENNGHVWISSISGGNPGGFTYKWFNYEGKLAGKPDSLNRLDSIPAGTYYLRTRDLYCEKWDSVTLTEPAGMSMPAYKLSFTPDSLYNVSCAGGNNGSIDITVTGGTLPYNYFWTDSASYSATTQVISSLKAGTYVCKITDANGCILKLPPLSKLPSFALTEPPALNIASVVSNSAFGGFNINCNGNNSGSISTTVTGGGGVYQYTWSTTNGSGIVAGQKDQTTLTAGTYHLDVTDLYGCHAVMDSTLTEPAKLSATLVPTQITCAAPLFNNGSIDLTPAGGVTPYSFLWSNGMTTEDITGLTQGNYSVTITDANGCIKTDNVTINLPPPVGYSKTLSDKNGFNISCNGMSDGSIDISPTSGTPPYSYTWTLPDLSTRTTQNISGLKAGDYQLEITDSKLCQVDSTITLKEPGKLDMTVNLSQSTAGGYSINCAGAKTGSIDITPVNAVGTVKYFWSDGSSSKTRTDIPAGVYTVIITDANYCHADSTVTLTEPDSLKLSFTVSEPWCPDKPDGAIVATVKGGVVGTDYNYKWSDNSTGNSLSNILPGIYSLTVTDMNNCPATKSIDLKAQHESCLVIPNAISPNGDGINDVWHIGYIELYPNAEIMIFNRWGETLWRSARGYPDPWDGTSNGSTLPIDSYHYIIDLHNGRKPIVGNVTIVK
ncbi:MAG: gliding motility-associated C-terminal domain-containing protein, partial [Bacteroidales bacterium]